MKPRRRSILDEIIAKDNETFHSDAHDDKESKQPELELVQPDVQIGRVETLKRGRLGRESRCPLLRTNAEEAALDDECESPATSLHSIDSRVSRSRLSFTPRTASSPISFPSLSDSGVFLPGQTRPIPPRTKSYTGSAGRHSRRNTAKSDSSSFSPASAFLSQWSRSEAVVTGPLDEGQEIGGITKYIIGRQVGYGGSSIIKEVFAIEDGARVRRAVKIVLKHINGKTEEENDTLQHNFEHEASIWRYLRHPYILPLIEVYETPYATFCITELNTGGTLHDLVRSLRRGHQSSSVSTRCPGPAVAPSSLAHSMHLHMHLKKRFLYQLANALRYLHQDLRIVHCDVKLENCLLNLSPTTTMCAPNTIEGNILLCDFGMADFISADDRDPTPCASLLGSTPLTTDIVGSLQYAAPETLGVTSRCYTPAADIWAFGVVCYALLTLKLPFDHEFAPKLTAMIQTAKWDLESLRAAVSNSGAESNDEDVEETTQQAVMLVRGCLEREVSRRWDIATILDCAFFDGYADLYDVKPGV